MVSTERTALARNGRRDGGKPLEIRNHGGQQFIEQGIEGAGRIRLGRETLDVGEVSLEIGGELDHALDGRLARQGDRSGRLTRYGGA